MSSGAFRVVQVVLVRCPTNGCTEEVAYGIQRCKKGHWIWWEDRGDGSIAKVRSSPVRFPQNGEVDFNGAFELQALTEPHDNALKGRHLRPGERVKIVGSKGKNSEYYELEGGEFLKFFNVVLRGGGKPRSGLICITAQGNSSLDRSEQGATVVKALEPGTVVPIFGEKNNFYLIGPDEWVWTGFVYEGKRAWLLPIANGYQTLDRPQAGANVVSQINLAVSKALWAYRQDGDFLQVGPNEWVWKGFVEVQQGKKKK